MLLYATCTAGFQEVAQEILRRADRSVNIQRVLSGGIVFEKKGDPSPLLLPCFHNVFEVLILWKDQDAPLERLMQEAISAKGKIARIKDKKTFRIVTSVENKLVSVQGALKAQMEQKIARDAGLRAARGGADEEYWFLKRRENMAFFMRRLTHRPSFEKTMKKGELHPDICFFMAWLAALERGDVVLDPFCGFGGIAQCVRENFPFGKLYASDNDASMVAHTRQRLKKHPNLDVFQGDALTLSRNIPQGSIDAIITDPPWGFFDRTVGGDETFYPRMFEEFERLLRDGGTVVLLTAKTDAVEAICGAQNACFSVSRRIPVLISGKKATAFAIKKQTNKNI